tara:strand:- start:2499 stop:2957 length:459 start_codon:yes stop_codon:yes gene_type:complete
MQHLCLLRLDWQNEDQQPLSDARKHHGLLHPEASCSEYDILGLTMAAKRLEEGSEYAEYDSNQDGIVSDEELQTSKELQELRLQHERADAQRAMSWFALWGMLLYPSLVVVSEFFGMNQAASILGDMAAVYFVSVAGILAAFFGAQAWSNRK